MNPLPETPEETTEELKRRSEAVRERLLGHIDALKDRKNQLADLAVAVKRQAKRHTPLLIGLGAVAAVTLSVIALRSRERRRRRERQDAILYAAARLLGPAYDVRRVEQKSPLAKGLRQLGKQLFVAASRELGHRALEELKLVATTARDEVRRADGAGVPTA
jgi:hypothetical protein